MKRDRGRIEKKGGRVAFGERGKKNGKRLLRADRQIISPLTGVRKVGGSLDHEKGRKRDPSLEGGRGDQEKPPFIAQSNT